MHQGVARRPPASAGTPGAPSATNLGGITVRRTTLSVYALPANCANDDLEKRGSGCIAAIVAQASCLHRAWPSTRPQTGQAGSLRYGGAHAIVAQASCLHRAWPSTPPRTGQAGGGRLEACPTEGRTGGDGVRKREPEDFFEKKVADTYFVWLTTDRKATGEGW